MADAYRMMRSPKIDASDRERDGGGRTRSRREASHRAAEASGGRAIADRLNTVRRKMLRAGVDILLVRSTDRYLNEYVPTHESARVWISGFTGSMGDVVISRHRAFLAVDGRYWLQAERETDPNLYEVVRVPLGTSIDEAIAQVISKERDAARNRRLKVGFEPDRITPHVLDSLKRHLGEGCVFKPLFPSPVEEARGHDRPEPAEVEIRLVDERRVGSPVKAKLAALAERLAVLGLDAILVQKLDEIAYLSNLRGSELPYQATFKAIALATRDNLFIAIDPAKVPRAVRVARDDIMFVPEAELWTLIGKKTKRTRVAYDRSNNTEQARLAISETGAEPVPCESPIALMKAKKNPAELEVMKEAFAHADVVVDRAQKWLCREVCASKRISEADFARHVKELFEQSGAVGLSFRIISAAGKNGAVIHYSDPSPRRVVRRGELMLLDTGAYYPEGYATDLTRTFLVDGPGARGDPLQCRYFTLVLKAAVAGMSAVFPEGTRGAQLDAITRAPLWAEGINFNHGTGHGVGINVHEFPPRIAPLSQSVLEEGFVFSIEPGLYMPSFGGVRIENLCTVEKAPGRAGFLRVVPLTFSPLDRRLFDRRLLTAQERSWLVDFSRRYRPRSV